MSNGTTPYYGPDEDATTIFIERTFVAGDLLCGLGYGIQLVMYCYCAHYLWTQRHTRKQSLFILAYITCIIAVSTIFVGVQAYTVQLVYIDNRNYPGGPWTYFLNSQSLPVNVMFEATLFLINFLSDMLVLWRCWIIWRAAGRVTAWVAVLLPGLMLIASFIMGTFWTLQSSQPGLSFYSKLPMAYGISYYTISLSLNVVLTLLIVVRLLWYRRTLLRSLPTEHARHYLSIATVLVESAALYSCFALGFLVSYAANNPINQIFLTLAQSSQQISTYLIIYRLADGRAWKSNTLARETLTTMQFDTRPPPVGQTISTSVATDETPTTPDISAPSTPDAYTVEKDGAVAWEEGRKRVQYVV